MSFICAYAPVSDLARILVCAAFADRPTIYSVDTLAKEAGVSRRTLQYRCQAVGVTARECVRFVQCLNALIRSGDNVWEAAAMLPISDARTLEKVLLRAGLGHGNNPTLCDFVIGQRFISSASCREAIVREVRSQMQPVTDTGRRYDDPSNHGI
jgi:AraC-like DNA-binding protein